MPENTLIFTVFNSPSLPPQRRTTELPGERREETSIGSFWWGHQKHFPNSCCIGILPSLRKAQINWSVSYVKAYSFQRENVLIALTALLKIHNVWITGKAINLMYSQFNLHEHSPSFAKTRVWIMKNWMTAVQEIFPTFFLSY